MHVWKTFASDAVILGLLTSEFVMYCLYIGDNQVIVLLEPGLSPGHEGIYTLKVCLQNASRASRTLHRLRVKITPS